MTEKLPDSLFRLIFKWEKNFECFSSSNCDSNQGLSPQVSYKSSLKSRLFNLGPKSSENSVSSLSSLSRDLCGSVQILDINLKNFESKLSFFLAREI